MIMDGTLGIKLRKKKNEIKIVKEAGTNYTFVDTTVLNLKHEIKADSTTNTNPNTEKDLIKSRSMGSRKSKIFTTTISPLLIMTGKLQLIYYSICSKGWMMCL